MNIPLDKDRLSDYDGLPQTEVHKYDPWPDNREEAREMQFRLIYRGKLPAQSQSKTRPIEKHQIRKVIHGQLVELWKSHPFLKEIIDNKQVETLANAYNRCGYRFMPLIGEHFGDLACGLDILFLRRDQPGVSLVRSGGDIDNRIKVLLDALTMPQSCNGLQDPPAHDENPFFCLLQDDSLISELRITTDRLLTPLETDESLHDVHLIIQVKTLVTSGSNLAFLT